MGTGAFEKGSAMTLQLDRPRECLACGRWRPQSDFTQLRAPSVDDGRVIEVCSCCAAEFRRLVADVESLGRPR